MSTVGIPLSEVEERAASILDAAGILPEFGGYRVPTQRRFGGKTAANMGGKRSLADMEEERSSTTSPADASSAAAAPKKKAPTKPIIKKKFGGKTAANMGGKRSLADMEEERSSVTSPAAASAASASAAAAPKKKARKPRKPIIPKMKVDVLETTSGTLYLIEMPDGEKIMCRPLLPQRFAAPPCLASSPFSPPPLRRSVAVNPSLDFEISLDFETVAASAASSL